MKFDEKSIIDLYKSEAIKYGDTAESTIKDKRIRNLEKTALIKHLCDGKKIIELGCGNGFVSEIVADKFNVDLTGIDLSREMITIAKKRGCKNSHSKLSFKVKNILNIDEKSKYDIAYSIRCLQNIPSWELQKKALFNVANMLKPGGVYIMIESFNSGLNKLNLARKELDLPAIKEPWHNNYFDQDRVCESMTEFNLDLILEDCFLSGFFFGSRVIYPVLLKDSSKASYESVLNDYFVHFPPYDDFSPIKLLLFKKNE